MKILVVAMADSVHTARWLSQIADLGWDISLLPVGNAWLINPEMHGVKVYSSLLISKKLPIALKPAGFNFRWWEKVVGALEQSLVLRFNSNYKAWLLAKLIEQLKPDIIHSMETQRGGYLVAETKDYFHNGFPVWIHSIWGSDLFLFGRLPDHRDKIRDVLVKADYLFCESNRDVKLARNLGYKGEILPIFQASGGMAVTNSDSKILISASKRQIIAVKGYQSWAGRALVALRAIERCHSLIEKKGLKVVIYLVEKGSDVEVAAKWVTAKTGLNIECLYVRKPRNTILDLLSKSRIHVGLSISDGVPTTMLESMMMGAFPIQSNTSAADEWITDGKTGLLVHPEEPALVEKAIRKAILSDTLVDRAAKINRLVIKKRMNYEKLKNKTLNIYQKLKVN